MSVFYHGGARRLDRRGLILPPTRTGAKSTAAYGAAGVCRRDRVYLTSDVDEAAMFALLCPPNGGDVYEVVPLGDVEIDPDYSGPAEVVSAPMARVVRVVQRNVREWHGLSTEQVTAALMAL